MRLAAWMFLFLCLLHPGSFAGTRDAERPDREMLRLMDLLQEWEIIQELDLMRQLDTLESAPEKSSEQGDRKSYQGSPKDRQR